MRCLVTGGGGFLGSHIVKKLLTRGDEVIVVGRCPYPRLESLGAICKQADIRDAKRLSRLFANIDEVYHCAALAGIWGRYQDYYSINVEGSKNVLDACKQHYVRRLIYTSSPSVVFDGKDQRGVDESHPYPRKWLTHYPYSKMLAEKMILAANSSTGLRTVALRPHLIWGPGDTQLIPRIVQRAKMGKLIQVGDGKNLVDIVHVENAAMAHLQVAAALVKSDHCSGKTYFISQGEPVELWTFIADVLKQAGVKPIDKKISYKTAYRVGAVLEWLYRITGKTTEPRLTRFLASQLATDHYYNIDRAKHDFKYQPSISTNQGLKTLFNETQP